MSPHQPPRGVGRGHRARSGLTYGDQQALAHITARGLLAYDATLRNDLPRVAAMVRAMFQAGYDLTVTETHLSAGIRAAFEEVSASVAPRRARDKDVYLRALLSLTPHLPDLLVQAHMARFFGEKIRADIIERTRQEPRMTADEAEAVLAKYKSPDAPSLLDASTNLVVGEAELPETPPKGAA